MQTILIVNGEKYWPDFFPKFKVVQKKIQDSHWVLKNGQLLVADKTGTVRPDAILWRIGAIKPSTKQTTALQMIKLAGIPCVNDPETLLQGYDRLSMLAALKQSDLPLIDFDIVTKGSQLSNISRAYPFVVKSGNYHGGYGKVLVEDEKQWQDVKDLLFMSEDYVTIEPFIHYERDIRYIAIEEDVWAMSRKGAFWKANVETQSFEIIECETALAEKVKGLKKALKADIIAVDILEEKSGNKFVVEYNDIPGLSGFSDELRYALANSLTTKLSIFILLILFF